MDSEITQTMNSSLDYFFASLGGKNTLSSFLQHWIPLTNTIQTHYTQLKEETLVNAHNLVSTVDTIASIMLELETHKEIMQQQLAKDISYILNDDMENLVIRDELPIPTGNGSIPLYVQPCSQWLLANLHNPYPPKSVRNSIRRQTGSSAKDLDAWFTDVRKRIGWNHLRRTRFSNRREKIIDAATSFFKPSRDFFKPIPSEYPLDGSDDHSMAFIEMEECAKRLFSDKFEETSLARNIDQIAQDLSVPSSSQLRNQTSQLDSQDRQINATKSKRHAYPSPEHTPEHSPEPPSPSIIAIPSTLLLPASHKRRRFSSETCADDITPDRPQKRLRPTHTQDSDNALAAASLPSPAASPNESPSPTSCNLTSATPPPSPASIISNSSPTQTMPSTKRKRSTSDSEDQRPSKYLQPASLSRIASNPLPISNTSMRQSSTQDLSQGDLRSQSILNYIPSFSLDPVLDDSAPLEISCYQFPLEDEGVHVHNPMLMPRELTPAVFQGTIDWSVLSGLSTWVDRPQDNSRDVANNEFGLNGQDFIELDINNLFGGLPTVDEIYAPTSALFNDWTTVVNQPFNIDTPSVGDLGVVLDKPSAVHPALRNPTELAAKRERAELLRAELKRLEADIA